MFWQHSIGEAHTVRRWEDFASKDPQRFQAVMHRNRETIRTVKHWMRHDTYVKSIWRYGMPTGPRDTDTVEEAVTYTDIMLFLASFLKKQISFLEIGVSAGKNFLQVCEAVSNGTLTGLDVEEINPVLEEFFDSKALVAEWDHGRMVRDVRGAHRPKTSTLTRYTYPKKHNTVYYLSGDKFNENCWKRLQGNKYNLIFSDALHLPISLQSEFQMLRKYELLDEEEFVIVWDDLGGRMTLAFRQLVGQLEHGYDLAQSGSAIVELHGSQNVRRKVGVALKLEGFVL